MTPDQVLAWARTIYREKDLEVQCVPMQQDRREREQAMADKISEALQEQHDWRDLCRLLADADSKMGILLHEREEMQKMLNTGLTLLKSRM